MDDVSVHGDERLVKVSGIGQDRPGIVFKIASVLKKHGGNVILQRSMQVAGEFAVVIVASFPKDGESGAQEVLHDLTEVPLKDFVVLAREIKIANFAPALQQGTKYSILVEALDRLGIIESVTLFLLQKNLNLDSMQSEVTHRPFEGTAVFKSTFEITIPIGFDIEAFKVALKEFEKTNELDVKLELVE